MNIIDRLQAISRDESEWETQATLREVMRGVAHEVKNPLGGIRGAAQLLSAELSNPALGEYTDIIISEVDRLRTLVDRMLGPRDRLETLPTNIHEISEHVRQLPEPKVLSRGWPRVRPAQRQTELRVDASPRRVVCTQYSQRSASARAFVEHRLKKRKV